MNVSYFLFLGPGPGLVLSVILIQTVSEVLVLIAYPVLVLDDLVLFFPCRHCPSTPPNIAVSS